MCRASATRQVLAQREHRGVGPVDVGDRHAAPGPAAKSSLEHEGDRTRRPHRETPADRARRASTDSRAGAANTSASCFRVISSSVPNSSRPCCSATSRTTSGGARRIELEPVERAPRRAATTRSTRRTERPRPRARAPSPCCAPWSTSSSTSRLLPTPPSPSTASNDACELASAEVDGRDRQRELGRATHDGRRRAAGAARRAGRLRPGPATR